jgi:MFS family permease
MPRVRLLPNLAPFRDSRDLRLVVGGDFVSGMGAQATLVALPYQLYVQTHSALLVGLLGAVELGPLIAMALIGGAIADRMDRRTLLVLDQIGVFAAAGGLAAAAFIGHPAVITLYVLGALLAGFNALQSVAQSAIIPNLVDPEQMAPALALNYGLTTLTQVVGPGLGGVLIGVFGVQSAYAINAVGCLAVVVTALAIAPQPPHGEPTGDSIRRSIVEGLAHVRANRALLGSFAIDLVAMTFGMPRALFAVLSVSVFHAGAFGTGVLYASVSAGATVAAVLTGWIQHARRLGIVVIWAVTGWGIAITLAGVMPSLWPAAALLAVAGAADSVSAVCRSTINQSVTPDHMRGRMSSVFSVVVTGGPRLGDVESGSVAGAFGARFSVASGGLLCLAGVAAIVLAFPALARYDTHDWIGDPDPVMITGPV